MLNLAINKREKSVNFTEINQSVEISIAIPEKFIVSGITDIDEVYNKVSELSPLAKSLANNAFFKNDKKDWDTVQKLLYYWNYRDLTRMDRTKDNTSLVEHALRKIILDIQLNNLPKQKLECINEFTPDRAVQELADKACSHRINKHPLLEEMVHCGISPFLVKKFLENYYVNNRLFHLFIVALSFCTPLERRTELANNFYDEMGAGDTSMAHPLLFLKNFNTIGKPSVILPLPEALSLANEKTYVAYLSGDYHLGMGGFGFIELTMPNQMKKILAGLGKSGIPKSDLEFWDVHISIDVEHGKTWFSEMLHLIKTAEQAEKCLIGGMRLLDARAAMYDGILGAAQ